MTVFDVVLVRHGAVNSNGRGYGQRSGVALSAPAVCPPEATAAVTHGGPIRLVLRYVLDLSWAQAFTFDPAGAA